MLAPWGTPTSLMLPANADDPSMTADALELYFNLGGDICVSTRETATDPWGAEVKVEELSSTANETSPEVLPDLEGDPWLSADGRHILFESSRGGSYGLWESSR